MNPYVFIVGCPRSGTTLLERIVNAHPYLAVVHESRWIARIYEDRRGLTDDGRVTPKLAARLTEPRSAVPFGMSADQVSALIATHDGAPFARFVSALFDLFAERHAKPLAGDKSPGYVRYLRLLHELWPRARFLHIVRDGRDVFLSVRDWGKGAARFSTYGHDPAVTVARWWDWYVRLGREAGRDLGPGLYHELRYEDLVAAPEELAHRLSDFLGLPFDPAMLQFHEGRERDNPRLDAKKAWRPVTRGLRSWRQSMTEAEVSGFESVAGDLLAECGYPLATTADGLRQDQALTVNAFDREVRATGRPVPSAWTTTAS